MAEKTAEAEIPLLYPWADGFKVGDRTLAYITRMRQPVGPGERPSAELLVGNVLRRTCQLGGAACAASGCQSPGGPSNLERQCADMNLKDVVERIGIDHKDVLMVGVAEGGGVGFYDEIEERAADVKVNSVGIRELPGYNAFFARESEGVVLGARLADCGFAAIEFKDKDGEDVIGFVHLTRSNMQGETQLEFEVNGQPAGSFEYYLDAALKHYGGDISTVKVHLIAAIKGENFQRTFVEGKRRPEVLFPGWTEQGMLVNLSNPGWQPGDDLNPDDIWEPQYREMVRWHIMRSGIAPEQVSEEGIIDPADLELGHASKHAGLHGKMPDGRDAYLVMARSYLRQ